MASTGGWWHTRCGNMDFETVIGLETHVQLKTRSKMWCGCPNAFGAEPNTNVCPVCLGMPGVLPVANDEALRLTVLTGFLLNCEIPSYAKFDRKNYFYPDSAKNYQVTQYDRPSTQKGWVLVSPAAHQWQYHPTARHKNAIVNSRWLIFRRLNALRCPLFHLL